MSDGKLTIAKAISQLVDSVNLDLRLNQGSKSQPIILQHQLCLAHIQRSCQTYLTQRPKTEAGQALKRVVDKITNINSHSDKEVWLKELSYVTENYLDFIQEKTKVKKEIIDSNGNLHYQTKWWYTHKYLRRAYIHLTRHLDQLFFYLDDPTIPRTNNILEGFISSIKLWLKRHRGLKRSRFNTLVFYLLSYRFLKKQGLTHKTIGMKIYEQIR